MQAILHYSPASQGSYAAVGISPWLRKEATPMQAIFQYSSLLLFFNMKILVILIILIPYYNLLPQQSSLSKGVNYISEYIASEHFQALKKTTGDLQLTDSIYVIAVNFYKGNMDEALLALAFATVPYKIVPIQIPVIKVIVGYPLVSDNDSIFLKKNDQLPGQLYPDTPQNEYGDKDKLAHFFGSAFISYKSHIFDLGDLIGYFVEVFEESFKVQSQIDIRDLETNKLGNLFGEMLKKNSNILPSQILLIPTLKNIRYNL